jgi:hypothetical protein
MCSENRIIFNIVGAFLILIGSIFAYAAYEECIHPQEMAKLGFVQVEGGRFVPVEVEDEQIEALNQRYAKLVQELRIMVTRFQRQINELKLTKRDK